MWSRSVVASADVSDCFAIGRGVQVLKWTAWRDKLLHQRIGNVDAHDAVGIAVRRGWAGAAVPDVSAIRKPSQLLNFPVWWSNRFDRSGFHAHQPQSRMLV